MAAQIEGDMSDDGDSDDEDEQAPPKEGTGGVQGEGSGSGTNEDADEAEDEDEASKAQDLLASLIAASTSNTLPDRSTATSAAPASAVSIDPVLESLAASLASTPVVSRAASPSLASHPRSAPAAGPPLRPDASSSGAADPTSADAGQRPGPTPTMFAPRTYSSELPQFTDGSALSDKAVGKLPDRSQPVAQGTAAAASSGKTTPASQANGAAATPRQAATPQRAPATKAITNPSAPTGGVNATSLNELQTMPNGEPPNYPWSTIIRAAILGSPFGILSKREIIKVVLAKWPPFHKRGKNLDAAITYNLRAKLCFIRVRVTGEGRMSFYIVDTTVDAGKARLNPAKPRTAAQRRALPPFTASRYSIAFAYSRNTRSGKTPAFLPPPKPTAAATQAAVDQTLLAALSELTGQKPPPPAPRTPEKVVQPQCQIKGSNVVTKMRYANGANSDDDPDPSEDEASTDDESEEEEDDEQPEDMEAARASDGRGGPRLGSSLTALIGGSSSAPLPTRRGLGSSLSAIGGPSAASARWASRPATVRPSERARERTKASASNATALLDAQIAAALAGVGAQLGDESSDGEDEDEDEADVPDDNPLVNVAPPGLDLSAINKEIEAALASDSDSDEDDDDDEDVEMDGPPLDFDALIAQASGQETQTSAPPATALAPAPQASELSTTPAVPAPAPAAGSHPLQALMQILQPSGQGTKRTADEAGLDADTTSQGAAALAALPEGVVDAIKELLKNAPTEPTEPTAETEGSASSAVPSADAALNAAIARALASQKGTTESNAPASAAASEPATVPPPRRIPAPPIISTYIPKRGQTSAQRSITTARPASAQGSGNPSSSPGSAEPATPQVMLGPDGQPLEKPKATYPELAKEAISSAPDRLLTAADIFQIIEEKHP